MKPSFVCDGHYFPSLLGIKCIVIYHKSDATWRKTLLISLSINVRISAAIPERTIKGNELAEAADTAAAGRPAPNNNRRSASVTSKNDRLLRN